MPPQCECGVDGTRNGAQHPFAAEARGLLRGLAQSHSLVAYSKPEDGDESGKDYDVSGRLSVSLLQRQQVPKQADFYLCGPPVFLRDFTADLKSWGVGDSCIQPAAAPEVFGAESSITPGIASQPLVSPHPPAENIRRGPEDFVHMQRSYSAVERAVWKSSRIRGSLRYFRQVVVPDGCLPLMRVRIDRWKDLLRARAARSAG